MANPVSAKTPIPDSSSARPVPPNAPRARPRAVPKMLLLSAVISACGSSAPPRRIVPDSSVPDSGAQDSGGNTDGARITIKGAITVSRPAQPPAARGIGGPTLNDAAKVLVFSTGTGLHPLYHAFVDIVDGSFSVEALPGTAAALIFLTADYQYIGHLRASDLSLLPLGELADGDQTVIDLESLTLEGTHVLPSHDPVGDEIIIGDAALLSLREVDAYYESLSRNMDTDDDGVIDFLDQDGIFVSSIFGLYVGQWGVDSTPPSEFDDTNYYLNYTMSVQGDINVVPSRPVFVLSGPLDAPYADIEMFGAALDPGGNLGFSASFVRETVAPPGSPYGSAFLPFARGVYSLAFDDSEVRTFEFSNTDAYFGLIIVAPTLTTDGNGQATAFSLEYQLIDGQTVNPASVLGGVRVQLSNSTVEVAMTPWLTAETGFYDFTFSAPVDLSEVNVIGVWYEDMLGNSYVSVWQ